jgi:hypothetical protein
MLLISKTYEIITEESASQGDSDERGFEFEDESYSFIDLVNELRCNWIGAEISSDTRITQYGDMDMHSGDYKNVSLHIDTKRNRDSKYWDKALKASKVSK